MSPLRRLDLSLLRHALDRPIGGSGVSRVDVIVAQLEAHDGTQALGFGFALASSGVPGFHAACEIGRTLLDGDALPDDPRACWETLARGFNRTGRGPNYLGLCAIDVALWDLAAKHARQPLWRCFSDTAPKVPLYCSGGFSAADSIDDTGHRIADAADRGFRAVKLRIDGLLADAPRVQAAVALATRAGVRVMLDVNEKGRRPEFMSLAAELRGLPLEWIEEPFPSGDLRAYRALNSASPLPIAAGEHAQGMCELLPFIDEGPLLRVVQPDLAMMGGLSECLRVAEECARCGPLVAPHFLPGLFAHLPGMAWLEEFALLEPLFEGWPVADGAMLAPGDEPGHGLRLSDIAQRAPVIESRRLHSLQHTRMST